MLVHRRVTPSIKFTRGTPRGTFLCEISEQLTKLKSSKKGSKDLKNSQKRKSSAKVKWKQSLKSGEVYFAAQRAMIKFWETVYRSVSSSKEQLKAIRPFGFTINTLCWVVCLPHKFNSAGKCGTWGMFSLFVAFERVEEQGRTSTFLPRPERMNQKSSTALNIFLPPDKLNSIEH